MAANMIGYQKTMMVVLDDNNYLILINPTILKTSNKTYVTEEGCLSLQGVRKTQRYESIKVSYLDINFKKKIKTFKGYPSLEVITIFFRTTFKSFLSICRFYRLFLYF